MKFKTILARIHRSGLKENANGCYRDHDSEIVKSISSMEDVGFVGIQNEQGRYTVVAKSSIYYSTDKGIRKQISHTDFLNLVRKKTLSEGKTKNIEFVEVDNDNQIWVLDSVTMNSIWNIVLCLCNIK